MKTIYYCIDLLSMIQNEKYDTCIINFQSMIQKVKKSFLKVYYKLSTNIYFKGIFKNTWH